MAIFLVHGNCGTKIAQYVGGDFCPDMAPRYIDYVLPDGTKPVPGSEMECPKCGPADGSIHHEIDPEEWRF